MIPTSCANLILSSTGINFAHSWAFLGGYWFGSTFFKGLCPGPAACDISKDKSPEIDGIDARPVVAEKEDKSENTGIDMRPEAPPAPGPIAADNNISCGKP